MRERWGDEFFVDPQTFMKKGSRRNIIKGFTAIFIIVAISAYEMMVPWYGNATDYSKIEWYQYIEFLFCLMSGPLSGIYDPLRWGNQTISSLPKEWLIAVGTAVLLSYVPTTLAFISKKHDILLLFIGLFFWVLSAHIFVIGVRV